MKAKTFFLTLFLSVAAVSLWAQGGQRVYIRATSQGTLGKTSVVIYEKGQITELEIENILQVKKVESVKGLADLLEKYFNQGYKLLSVTNSESFFMREYIFEKQ